MVSQSSEKPIFLQVMQIIENGILANIYKADELIPSTTELAKFYSINIATANKAITLLVEKKILYKKRGIGMFVDSNAKKSIIEEQTSKFNQETIKIFIKQAKLLNITIEELEKKIQEEYYSND